MIFLFVFISPINAQEFDQALFEQAFQESKQGNFEKALSDWNQFLDIFPDSPAALSNRGNVLLAMGKAKSAIADQTKAIKLEPQDPDPHLNRGIAEESLKLWDDAINDYQWILERNPTDVSALYNLGNVMGSLGNWSKAEALYAKASNVQVGFVMASASEALAQYQLGEFDLAELELRKLIRKYPMFADARAALSALLWRKGSLGEAESNWVAVAGLDIRYREADWLLNVRRWPPKPIDDLMAFLSLERE